MLRQTRFFQIPVIVLLTVLLLGSSACKKTGTLEHKIKCTTDKNAFRALIGSEDTFKSGLGNYITSITPYSVKSRMNLMSYHDDWREDQRSISYIDGHDNDPRYTIELYLDFSNNAEVKPKPILYGRDMRDGLYEKKEVTMIYFLFTPYHINIEFALPFQYNTIPPYMFEDQEFDTTIGRRICKTNENKLTQKIWSNTKTPGTYLFGNTDSTFIYNPTGLSTPNSKDRFFGAPNWTVIRSDKFTPSTVRMPDPGETLEMYSTIVYDTENIIQIYAGNDNIPYTQDDVFIYAPRYWERIKVKLETR
jgi:hypothetical protein